MPSNNNVVVHDSIVIEGTVGTIDNNSYNIVIVYLINITLQFTEYVI